MPTLPTSHPRFVDTHAHVFHRGLRFIAERRFTPTYDAPLDAYLSELDRNGISCGVLIALSILGNDNSYMLECLRREPSRLRGVVAIDPATDLDKLDGYQSTGVVGIRVNLTGGLQVPDFKSGAWKEAVAECMRRDWHIEINDRCSRLDVSVEPLVAMGAKVVVDHFGMPDKQLGTADPGFARLLEWGATKHVWVKLSGAYRTSVDIARDAAPMLLESFGPDRLLWASDWPFTQYESHQHSYAAQRSLLDIWLPDSRDRETVLSRTPIDLFKF